MASTKTARMLTHLPKRCPQKQTPKRNGNQTKQIPDLGFDDLELENLQVIEGCGYTQ
jgi:hypothetical protein